MRVLITGSSGSLGKMIAKSLINKEIQVAGVDLKEPAEAFPGEYFRFYRCCITEREALEDIFRKVQPTHIIHLACSFNKIRNRVQEYGVDVGGSKNILEAANKTSSVKQLVYSSSAAAYGGNRDNPQWLNESYPLNPGGYSYGINKRSVEEIFLEMPVREDLRVVIARICTVVGPSFNKPASVVSILVKWSWLPEFCRENKVQFLHSDDFISLINLMIGDDQIKGIFNVAPDSYSVIKELLPDKKYFKVPVPVITGFLHLLWHLKIMNLQPAAINNSIYPILLDPSKIISRFGYKFKYSSNEAFEDTRLNNCLPSGITL